MFARVSKHNQIQFRLHCTDSLLLLNTAALNVTLGTESVITDIIFLLFDIYEQQVPLNVERFHALVCFVTCSSSHSSLSLFFHLFSFLKALKSCCNEENLFVLSRFVLNPPLKIVPGWTNGKTEPVLIDIIRQPEQVTPFLLSLASRLTYTPLGTADVRVQFLNC